MFVCAYIYTHTHTHIITYNVGKVSNIPVTELFLLVTNFHYETHCDEQEMTT